MQITADTHDLKPPRPGRWLGPVGLALLAHALLMGALTWGVHWKDEPLVSFEAELWSSVPREAAPRAVEPPPPPPPPPPEPEPRPEPKPEPRPAPPPPPVVKEAEIATAQAKKKAEAEKREEAKKVEAKRKAEAMEKEKEKEKEAKKEAAEKLAADKKAREKKLADQKAEKAEKAERAREVAEEKLRDQLRREQVARMMGQVGASGSPNAQGSAAQSSGPSSSYAGRVQARIRPNILYQQDFPASLRTEVEVRAAPDGTITGRRVVKSSGNNAWDDAALRAIDRTGSLPRDVDGRVPSPLILSMRPLD